MDQSAATSSKNSSQEKRNAYESDKLLAHSLATDSTAKDEFEAFSTEENQPVKRLTDDQVWPIGECPICELSWESLALLEKEELTSHVEKCFTNGDDEENDRDDQGTSQTLVRDSEQGTEGKSHKTSHIRQVNKYCSLTRLFPINRLDSNSFSAFVAISFRVQNYSSLPLCTNGISFSYTLERSRLELWLQQYSNDFLFPSSFTMLLLLVTCFIKRGNRTFDFKTSIDHRTSLEGRL